SPPALHQRLGRAGQTAGSARLAALAVTSGPGIDLAGQRGRQAAGGRAGHLRFSPGTLSHPEATQTRPCSRHARKLRAAAWSERGGTYLGGTSLLGRRGRTARTGRIRMIKKFTLAAVTAVALALPLSASAQDDDLVPLNAAMVSSIDQLGLPIALELG